MKKIVKRIIKRLNKDVKFLFEPGMMSIIRSHPIPGISKYRLAIDIFICKLYYGILTKEYFFFSFYDKSRYARKQYVGTIERERVFRSLNNSRSDFLMLDSKKDTYDVYKVFFHRELIRVALPQDISILYNFLHEKQNIIIKPIASSKGRGVKIIKSNDLNNNRDIQDLMNLSQGEYVVEELVKQDASIACFHPESVNTIRLVTYFDGHKLTKLFALFRMGVGDSCIDNTCSGGISAAVDINTGVIISEGTRQNGERFYFHPNTGVQIIGRQIPRWEELNRMVEDIVMVRPQLKIVGWDFALSENGWLLIEGNTLPSFFGIQIALNKGVRSWFKALK